MEQKNKYIFLNIFLDKFFEGGCSTEKGHQPGNFGESWLMAWKERSKGMDPLETVFLFYRISPKTSTPLKTGQAERR